MLNKKKCGIMPLRGRDNGNFAKSFLAVPLVNNYKYLGIPMDPSLTLKNVLPVLLKRALTFKRHISALKTNVVSIKLRLEAWKVYFKSIFDYMRQVFMLVGKMSMISTIYSTTLKKACCLPLTCKNDRLFDLLRIPTPEELGAYFITIAFEKILIRKIACPDVVKGAYFGALILSDRYKDKRSKNIEFRQSGYTVCSLGRTVIDCLTLASD